MEAACVPRPALRAVPNEEESALGRPGGDRPPESRFAPLPPKGGERLGTAQRRSGLDDAVPDREADQLGAALGTERFHERVLVRLHRARRNVELLRDLLR